MGIYRQWYKNAKDELERVNRELNNFKEEVYEKEALKRQEERIKELELNFAVVRAEKFILAECNQVLKDAIQRPK